MVCPSCSHIFVIKDGIPNMVGSILSSLVLPFHFQRDLTIVHP